MLNIFQNLIRLKRLVCLRNNLNSKCTNKIQSTVSKRVRVIGAESINDAKSDWVASHYCINTPHYSIFKQKNVTLFYG